MPEPCWIAVRDDGGEIEVHHATRREAERDLGTDDGWVARLATPCSGGAVCAVCSERFDEEPCTHYPSPQAAVVYAAEGGWYRIAEDVWCCECQQTAPEVAEDRAWRERAAASTPLPGLEVEA